MSDENGKGIVELDVSHEDIAQLLSTNPLAAAQLENISLRRKVAELEAELANLRDATE